MRSITHYRPHCQQPYTHTAGEQQCQETAVWQQIHVPACMHMCTRRNAHKNTNSLTRKDACAYTQNCMNVYTRLKICNTHKQGRTVWNRNSVYFSRNQIRFSNITSHNLCKTNTRKTTTKQSQWTGFFVFGFNFIYKLEKRICNCSPSL